MPAEGETPPGEFLFGRLSTPDGRAVWSRERRSGLRHDTAISPVDPLPGEPVTVNVIAGADDAVTNLVLAYTTDGSIPSLDGGSSKPRRERVSLTPGHADWDTLTWGYRQPWTGTIPGQPDGTLVRYVIGGTSADGTPVGCGDGAPVRLDAARVHTYHVDRFGVPAWLREAVVYQVFVDRFAPDPGRAFADDQDLGLPLGGTLKGLKSRLDALSDLGVNTLWLTPIHPSPAYHGYDPTDLGGVEPRLGTLDDWDALVRDARGRGMRLILDFVANHTSDLHPFFTEARTDHHSPYVEWFQFTTWPTAYRGFFDLPEMPVWNTDHPPVRDGLITQAIAWLDRGADGLRLDHAQGPGPSFWAEFRARVRSAHPEAALVGEVTEPPDVLRRYAGRMDGVLDFTLAEVLRGVFARGDLGVTRLAGLVARQPSFFDDGLCLPAFLDNHDMNRFLWVAGGDLRRLRLGALALFTLPGPPVVYYGTELGLSQRRGAGRLEESRLPMPWGRGEELRVFFKELIRFRRAGGTAWWSGTNVIRADDARRLLVFRSGPFQVVLHPGEGEASVDLPAPPPAGVVFATSAGGVAWDGVATLRLGPWQGAVLA